MFNQANYWLRKNSCKPEWHGSYVLTNRIDMSYKGKHDQEGGVVMFLNDSQAQLFRDAGFSEIDGGIDPTDFLQDKKSNV